MSDAEILRSLPAARGQVKDGGGSHVGGFGIMRIIVTSGGGLSKTTVHAGTWGRCSGEWRFGCGQNKMLMNGKDVSFFAVFQTYNRPQRTQSDHLSYTDYFQSSAYC